MAEAIVLTRLIDNARIHLPSAMDNVLKIELFNVLDEFCQKTKYWQEEIDYDVEVDRTCYELVGGESGQIIELLRNVNSADVVVPATMKLIGTIDLKTEPSVEDTFTATVAYTVVDPTDTNDYPFMPDEVLHKYGQGIMHGLIGAMMAQPAKPYSNQQLAVFHTRKFAGTIANARADVAHRNLYDGQTWRFPKWA